ncbi:MAG: hypothetical protein IJX19_04900, partial [Clostridia bacterium]|nr:hypothetical protein [Clostridia bacterium]
MKEVSSLPQAPSLFQELSQKGSIIEITFSRCPLCHPDERYATCFARPSFKNLQKNKAQMFFAFEPCFLFYPNTPPRL